MAVSWRIKRMDNKKRSKLDLITAFVGGIAATVFIAAMVFVVFYQKGYIHVGVGGDVYVSDVPVDDSDGIGSQAEGKLNAIDSVVSEGFYFGDIDHEAAIDSICRGYLSSLGDKYTTYYSAEQYKKVQESTTGIVYGIGALCKKAEDGTIYISGVYDESPAQKAGLKEDDFIETVDNKSVIDMELESAIALIKGEKDTQVELGVIRDGEKFKLRVTRGEIKLQTVSWNIEDGVGYIYITQFDKVTVEQFTKALNDLKEKGMTGLIIDLRDNPGGVLDGTVSMLDELLPEGLRLTIEYADGSKEERKGEKGSDLKIPIAVLVNGQSASAAEIFAGAVQDYGVGKIIGIQTFGKGIIQFIRPLTDGSAIKYTAAKYFTPKGQDIHGKGIKPDIIVELPEDATEDYQYKAALEYINKERKN